jgi:D-alanyl-D-alanine carboxypeptidase
MPNEPRGRRPARALIAIATLAVLVAALAVVLAGVATGGFVDLASSEASASTPASPVAAAVTPSSPPATVRPTLSPAPSPSSTPSAVPSPPGPSATPLPSPSGAPVPADRLQARLDDLRRKLSIPGVSVAILWDDGRQWLGVSGRSDVAGRTPMAADSGFALASISKTYTAAVILQLVEEGRLALDEPVARHLSAYGLDRRITVRMLLDHTSGLPDFFFRKGIDSALQSAPNATWTPEKAWSYVRKKRPVPGTTWSYSNTNYLLLGELVESVTGRPLADEIRERLLDPLGLEHTWYQAAEQPRTPITTGYRLLPKSGGGIRAVPVAPASSVMPFRSVVTAAGGAGSMAATALDTARWMQAFAAGGVLTPEMRRAMVDEAAATRAVGARVPYGMGIQVTSIGGRTALGHSGRYLGFRNVVRYLPGEGVTIAVLTNQGVRDPARIAAALLRIVLPAPEPSASPTAAPAG